MLLRKGRLELAMPVEDWVSRSEALPFLQFVPFDNRIALRSNRLPGTLHEDPADRAIIATALTLGAPLVTKDAKIRDYPHVRTVW
jgi:PIN domain nuclease of toxin-antitoxin system